MRRVLLVGLAGVVLSSCGLELKKTDDSSSGGDKKTPAQQVDIGDPTTAVNTREIGVGDKCANGGVEIEVGIDKNRDGVLGSDEVSKVEVVCNVETAIVATSAKMQSTAYVPGLAGNADAYSATEIQTGIIYGAEVPTNHYVHYKLNANPSKTYNFSFNTQGSVFWRIYNGVGNIISTAILCNSTGSAKVSNTKDLIIAFIACGQNPNVKFRVEEQ